jgi:hypothetical protein
MATEQSNERAVVKSAATATPIASPAQTAAHFVVENCHDVTTSSMPGDSDRISDALATVQ